MKILKTILAAVAVTFSSATVSADETIESETLKVWFDDIRFIPDGKTVTTCTIYEKDYHDYSAFNMTLIVPKGVRIAKIKAGRDYVNDIFLTERATITHSLSHGILADEGMAQGEYPVEMLDVKFCLSDGNACVPVVMPITGTFIVGSTTSVENVRADAGEDGAYYDLLGRPVSDNPAPVIYVRNSRKTLVK